MFYSSASYYTRNELPKKNPPPTETLTRHLLIRLLLIRYVDHVETFEHELTRHFLASFQPASKKPKSSAEKPNSSAAKPASKKAPTSSKAPGSTKAPTSAKAPASNKKPSSTAKPKSGKKTAEQANGDAIPEEKTEAAAEAEKEAEAAPEDKADTGDVKEMAEGDTLPSITVQ